MAFCLLSLVSRDGSRSVYERWSWWGKTWAVALLRWFCTDGPQAQLNILQALVLYLSFRPIPGPAFNLHWDPLSWAQGQRKSPAFYCLPRTAKKIGVSMNWENAVQWFCGWTMNQSRTILNKEANLQTELGHGLWLFKPHKLQMDLRKLPEKEVCGGKVLPPYTVVLGNLVQSL